MWVIVNKSWHLLRANKLKWGQALLRSLAQALRCLHPGG